jgi:alpha/beta superfamily hydrolase
MAGIGERKSIIECLQWLEKRQPMTDKVETNF